METRGTSHRPRTWPRAVTLVVCTFALALAGCKTLQDLSPKRRQERATAERLAQLQARNMRFADDYVGRLLETARSIEQPTVSPSERYETSGWTLAQANAAYVDASGDNAIISAIDLVTLSTLSRMVIEVQGPKQFPGQAANLLAAHRELEAASWELVDGVLTPAQQDDLRQVLEQWRAAHPNAVNVSFVRFGQFVGMAPSPTSEGHVSIPTSLMGLVGLDPMAGLDPAVRQVEQTRLLAERAMFYAQRVPILMDMQLDRAVNRLDSNPETQYLLRQVGELNASAAQFADVATRLPDTLASEREAMFEGLTRLLNAQESTLSPMLLDLRAALEAGNVTAASVDQAVRSIDALVAQFSNKPVDPNAPPGKPFDINDYTLAAESIAQAADQLQQLLGSLGSESARLGPSLDAGVAEGRSLVDYLFVRIAWLIAILLGGILVLMLIHRWLAPRVKPS